MVETHTSPWKSFASRWKKYYAPPGRPSKSAIQTYRKYSLEVFRNVKGRRPRALILGATPELRDLMFELGAEVTVADINPEVVRKLKSLMHHRKKAKEKLIMGDWSRIELPKEYFDVIVGDVVLGNVRRNRQPNFLRNMKSALAPNGHFIQKMEVIPDNWKFEDMEATLNRFGNARPTKNYSVELVAMLLHNTFDRKRRIASLKRIRRGIAQYMTGDRITHPNKNVRKLLSDIWAFWKPMEKEWSWDRESVVKPQVAKFFRIKKEIVLKDCLFQVNDRSFPIWVCAKA